MDAYEPQIVSKVDKPILEPSVLKKGHDLGPNEDAPLATSKGEAISEDPVVEKDTGKEIGRKIKTMIMRMLKRRGRRIRRKIRKKRK